MPITHERAEELQAKASHYGCGADSCKSCYPVQYACEYCTEDFDSPIENGESYTCPECGWNTAGYFDD